MWLFVKKVFERSDTSSETASPAMIEYDQRLHVDTYTATVVGSSENMLSVSARFPLPNNWTILNLTRNEHILLCTSVAEVWPTCDTPETDTIFSCFPPKVSHTWRTRSARSRRARGAMHSRPSP